MISKVEILKASAKKVWDFVQENSYEIVSEIAAAYNEDISSYKYVHFCEDGKFVIDDIYQEEDDLYCVVAKGEVHEGSIISTQDGPWPYDDCADIKFMFFVNVLEDGEMNIVFFRDENGNINLEETIIIPEYYD